MSQGTAQTGGRASALEFGVTATSLRARTCVMRLPHGDVHTPVFMPVGTNGSVKGLTPRQLEDAGCQIILGNTYHLESAPGASRIAAMGGLHRFSGWRRPMLTDSGGYQMVSLGEWCQVDEEGVCFGEVPAPQRRSRASEPGHCGAAASSRGSNSASGARSDGRSGGACGSMALTPEAAIRLQNDIGADIIMALDDVVPATHQDRARVAEAQGRTSRWLDRCLAAHSRPAEQSLFGIVQGGLDPELRARSLEDILARDTPGVAVGGLCGGEAKDAFWRAVKQCMDRLPPGKPRYVMGVGYPLDIVVCSCLGADMFDSVYPTRTARFGTALVWGGTLHLRRAAFAADTRPLDDECPCEACAMKLSRARLHFLLRRGVDAAKVLLLQHNVTFTQQLTGGLQEAIRGGESRLEAFVRRYLAGVFGSEGDAPEWVRDAMAAAGIAL
ncbi:unnamed protein product [Pedinophyceae sp. YPF-701]|nr:unnamed protein product [Pedinophyceae sp. YPF-701]